MSTPLDRPPAREAGPELLVLQEWEEFIGWLIAHTGRWPKSVRFTLAQRVENHALDLTEMLITARYEPCERVMLLQKANLLLERMRHLCRLAKKLSVMPNAAFESAMRGFDTTGRMLHGWRTQLDPRTGKRREAVSA
jgi:hypothetical protein